MVSLTRNCSLSLHTTDLQTLPERIFSPKDRISDPTLTPVNWIPETIKPCWLWLACPARYLTLGQTLPPCPPCETVSLPQLDGVEVGKWCKHWVMAGSGSGSGSAIPAREEARKQIYSSLPAWPESELVLALAVPEPSRAALVTSSLLPLCLHLQPSWLSLSLSLSLRDKRIRSWPPHPSSLLSSALPNLRLVSLRAKLLGNKWEWLPLPPSFIKLKAVKRNGESFNVNFYKVWTGISSSGKVIISDINGVIYVRAVMRVTSASVLFMIQPPPPATPRKEGAT